MDSSGKNLTKKQRFAAVLLAQGKSAAAVARHEEVSVSANTVRKWQNDPEFTKVLFAEQDALLEEFRHKLTPLYIDSAMRAVKVLRAQMQETDPITREKNDPYLRQNAAREMLNRGAALLEKTEDKAVEIHFVGMPVLGVPSSDGADPGDANAAINRMINNE